MFVSYAIFNDSGDPDYCTVLGEFNLPESLLLGAILDYMGGIGITAKHATGVEVVIDEREDDNLEEDEYYTISVSVHKEDPSSEEDSELNDATDFARYLEERLKHHLTTYQQHVSNKVGGDESLDIMSI